MISVIKEGKAPVYRKMCDECRSVLLYMRADARMHAVEVADG